MSRRSDVVTKDYLEAHRMGALIRTPIENIAFFKAEHKAVVAHTKNNGSFVLAIPIHEIQAVLADKVTMVHRSYLVANDVLPGLKNWRVGPAWVCEIITTVRYGERMGICAHEIPISRRKAHKAKELFKERA